MIFRINLLFLLFFCHLSWLSAQNEEDILGTWHGKLDDSTQVFDYILIVEKINNHVFYGTTYSNGANFYCETSVKGSITHNKVNIIEEKIIQTNYANKKALCLLSFFLAFDNEKLSGRFIPRNNFSTCRKGTVIFQKKAMVKEPAKA
jgi:hypothetical protein